MFSSSTDPKPTGGESKPCYHWQIRAATSEDLTAIAEILTNSFHSQKGILGWTYPLLRLGIYEDLRNRLRSNSPHQICLVAVAVCGAGTDSYYHANEQVVGTVEIGLRTTGVWASNGYNLFNKVPSRYLYLSNLAVHSNYRRQGVAQQLLLHCERVALSWGFQDLYLHVLENNHQARQLYFKLGYSLHHVDANGLTWLLKQHKHLFLHRVFGT